MLGDRSFLWEGDKDTLAHRFPPPAPTPGSYVYAIERILTATGRAVVKATIHSGKHQQML